MRRASRSDAPAGCRARGCRYWPTVSMSTWWSRKSRITAMTSSSVSPSPSIRPDLVSTSGRRCLERAQQLQRMAVVGTRARLAVQARHGLEVVIHHVRRRRRRARRARPPAGRESPASASRCACRATRLPHGTDAGSKVRGTAIAQVVAIDAGDDDVVQAAGAPRCAPASAGSSGRARSGRPCATSQNGQRRVHRSPRIMKVAVPCRSTRRCSGTPPLRRRCAGPARATPA